MNGTIRPFVYVDVETTGLEVRIHDVWEIAYAVGDGPIQQRFVTEGDIRWDTADQRSLNIGRFDERYVDPAVAEGDDYREIDRQWWWDFSEALIDATIVGANPRFDVEFIRKVMSLHEEPWHHRLLDVEAYAASVLGWPEPRSLLDTAEELIRLGAPVPLPDHTAAGDVATARAVHGSAYLLGKTGWDLANSTPFSSTQLLTQDLPVT